MGERRRVTAIESIGGARITQSTFPPFFKDSYSVSELEIVRLYRLTFHLSRILVFKELLSAGPRWSLKWDVF